MMAGGMGCRNVDLVEHTVEELMVPRVYGLAPGRYEDLHDHEEWPIDIVPPMPGKVDRRHNPMH